MGVWSFPFLLVIALSSLVFFLGVIGINVSWPRIWATEERAVVLNDGFNGQSVEAFIAATKEAVPQFKLKTMYFPLSRTGMLELLGVDGDYGTMVGTVLHKYHPTTLELMADEQVSQATTGHWLTGIGISLHYGDFGGIPVKALWLIFGIFSCYLLLTGARIFASRIVAERHGDSTHLGRGTFGLIWQGLGVVKWAYVLLPVVVVGVNLLKVLN